MPVIEPTVLIYKDPLQHLSDLPGLWQAFYSFFFILVSIRGNGINTHL